MRADCLPNVSVGIHVNVNALHEYHADSEDERTALCYVEAVSGAEFSILLTTEPDYAYRDNDLLFRASIDGHKVKSRIIGPIKMTEGHTSSIESVRRYEDGVNCKRKFTFAQHETSICHDPRCY
jgi:hypothetical protein